ncbi:MAG: DUF2442 domain-containing protein [Phycisphaerae bacterium]
MSTSGSTPTTTQPARAVRAWVRDRTVWVELEDGRQVGFPAAKYRRLRDASDELLARVRIEARGKALRWDELDEDLTVEGILAGRWLP